jgi:hypothetical protein
MIRSTSATASSGAVVPSTRILFLGASAGQAARSSATPSVVRQMSAGQRLKLSAVPKTLIA